MTGHPPLVASRVDILPREEEKENYFGLISLIDFTSSVFSRMIPYIQDNYYINGEHQMAYQDPTVIQAAKEIGGWTLADYSYEQLKAAVLGYEAGCSDYDCKRNDAHVYFDSDEEAGYAYAEGQVC